MTKSNRTTQGFTIIETIVALSVAMIVIIGMMQSFAVGMRHVRIIRADTEMAQNGAFLVQTIGQAVRHADQVDITGGGNTIEMIKDHVTTTLQYDPVDKTFRLDGNELVSDNVNVESATPSKIGKSLHLEFTLSSRGRQWDAQVSFTPYNITL